MADLLYDHSFYPPNDSTFTLQANARYLSARGERLSEDVAIRLAQGTHSFAVAWRYERDLSFAEQKQ